MMVQVYDRGKTPRSQHSEKGVYVWHATMDYAALKNNAPANGDLHLPTNGQSLLESESECDRRCFASLLQAL
jgi:hypothetical protein